MPSPRCPRQMLATLPGLLLLSGCATGAGEGTPLSTSVEASARPSDVSGNDVHGSSTGRLERAIAEAVAERLEGG